MCTRGSRCLSPSETRPLCSTEAGLGWGASETQRPFSEPFQGDPQPLGLSTSGIQTTLLWTCRSLWPLIYIKFHISFSKSSDRLFNPLVKEKDIWKKSVLVIEIHVFSFCYPIIFYLTFLMISCFSQISFLPLSLCFPLFYTPIKLLALWKKRIKVLNAVFHIFIHSYLILCVVKDWIIMWYKHKGLLLKNIICLEITLFYFHLR